MRVGVLSQVRAGSGELLSQRLASLADRALAGTSVTTAKRGGSFVPRDNVPCRALGDPHRARARARVEGLGELPQERLHLVRWGHRSAQPRPGHSRRPPPRERREVNAERRGKAVHVSAPVLVERGTRFHGDPRAATRARQHAVPVGRRQMTHVRRRVLEAATTRALARLRLLGSGWFEDLHGVVPPPILDGRPQRIQHLRFAADRVAWVRLGSLRLPRGGDGSAGETTGDHGTDSDARCVEALRQRVRGQLSAARTPREGCANDHLRCASHPRSDRQRTTGGPCGRRHRVHRRRSQGARMPSA